MATAAALCAGVGGLELALQQFGIEAAWYCEVDPDASTVLEKRLEGVPNLGDIQDRATWRTAPVPDILTAGFPCQPISAAGRQRHRADDRYLWPNVRDAIADLMPSTVFLENVQNLVSIDGGSVLAEVLGDLHALGYAVRWAVLGACAVGLSHHRHRWFLRAERVDSGPVPAPVRVDTATCGVPPRQRRLLPTPVARDGDPGQRGEGSAEYWQARRVAGRTSGAPLGAVVAKLLPSPRASDGRNGGPNQRGSKGDLALPAAVIGDRFAEYAWAIQRQIDTTGVLPPEPTEPNSAGSHRLAPRFPEWMMTFPAGWVTDVLDRVPALRCIGNGASPIQAAAAWRLLAPPDPLAHCPFCQQPTAGPLAGCDRPDCRRREIEMEGRRR